jgi:hypothetical protein
MPTIDTPFVMELHPGEELKLARTPVAQEGTSAATAEGTSAFAKNDFQAWVSSISFVEELNAEAAADATSAAAKSAHGHKHGVVRVSLVAHLLPFADNNQFSHKRDRDGAAATSSSSLMKMVTLASCNFSANTTASSADAALQSTGATRLESSVMFRSPLAFTSKGSIQRLSVVAENMATTAGSSGRSGSVKRYQGARRFAVRLQGLQQTSLTKDQVLLLAKR